MIGIGLAIYCGEAMPLATVVEMQARVPALLFRPRYETNFFAYKLLTAVRHQPAVLALGSSRVLAFRSSLFAPNPAVFYNAGVEGWLLGEQGLFLQYM